MITQNQVQKKKKDSGFEKKKKSNNTGVHGCVACTVRDEKEFTESKEK